MRVVSKVRLSISVYPHLSPPGEPICVSPVASRRGIRGRDLAQPDRRPFFGLDPHRGAALASGFGRAKPAAIPMRTLSQSFPTYRLKWVGEQMILSRRGIIGGCSRKTPRFYTERTRN